MTKTCDVLDGKGTRGIAPPGSLWAQTPDTPPYGAGLIASSVLGKTACESASDLRFKTR